MNGELQHMKNPLRMRLFWVGIYVIVIVVCLFGLYFTATQMKTHILPVGQIELSVPYSKYVVGETITFTIKNNFNSAVFVLNNCPSEPLAVYRNENNVWVQQHDEASASDCPEKQRQVSVGANAAVNGSFAAWHNLFSTPGKYRVVAFVEQYNALPYQEFEVIPKPGIVANLSPTDTSVSPKLTTPGTTQTVVPQTETPTTIRTYEEQEDESED